MTTESTRVTVDGAVVPEVTTATDGIEVREDVDAASAFRIRFEVTKDATGRWPYLDRDALTPWHRVTVEAGFAPRLDLLVDGHLTHVDASLRTDGSGTLELSGLDRSAVLDVEDRQRAWPDRTDAEIATQIFSDAGLDSVVDATDAPAVATVTVQSDTDMRFLRRLARRNGFECYVRGTVGYFRAPNLSEPPQPLLALAFGPRTNLVEARIEVDGTVAARVDSRRLDPFSKQVEVDSIARVPGLPLGRAGAAALPDPGGRRLRILRHQPAPSRAAAQARLAGAYRPTTRLVRLTGVADARAYGSVLRCNRLVTVTGLGERYSGLYYVTSVDHNFSAAGYTQRFTAYRDGVGLTGREQFGATVS